ncbi:MAG TPA: thioredoxin domain-containing protein [Verrucomicrobiae bacterium]|nr:thioredoxin domain-containing protein [Verrucomicrobiae bacterium]
MIQENRLARETSPYLRQHAHNPVDWYPWGEEALQRAKAEDKPIFLSIGYSACHWCHVMERESFENASIAALMNERFVNIKVDREERPDLDEIYMAATQMLARQGGWPNSVFLTPDLKPFFAGTYFPPEARYGRPGFPDILKGVADAYATKREEIGQVATEVAEAIQAMSEMTAAKEPVGPKLLSRAFGDLAGRFDPAHGGFGGAPKFPHSMDVSFLLRYHKRTGNAEALRMAVVSLDRMARGGLFDQIGGGFHRYSVDAQWLVPHFEKMLYDNALLARTYVEAAQAIAPLAPSPALPDGAATAAFFRQVARDTLDWTLREMLLPEGAFASSLDADSEGEEGRFYVWTLEEIEAAVGRSEAMFVAGTWGATREGNFEGKRNVLSLPVGLVALAREQRSDEAEVRLRLAGARSRLMQARDRRVRPGRDDKALADWNGLMIGALAFAGRVLDERRYVEAAVKAADLVLGRMRRDGRLLHSFLGGEARHNAYLTDYAAMIAACVDLFEATSDARWVAEAEGLARQAIDLFRDAEGGGFFFTARDHEKLIARTREGNDGALPAGASILALALPRLAALNGDETLVPIAHAVLRLYKERIERFPSAFGAMLCAVDQALDPPRQIVLAGGDDAPGMRALEAVLRERFLPNTVLARSRPGGEPIAVARGKDAVQGRAAAYVCTSGACQAPVTSADDLARLLADAIAR